MQKPTLLVLAAGMGSRYGGLKQIVPIGPSGETILDYSVYDAIRAGFGKVVFVIREDFEQAFRDSVGSRFADRIVVEYAFQRLGDLPAGFSAPERPKPWGTAHAVYAARHLVKEPCAVINADDFYGRDAYAKAAAFLTQPDADPSRYCIVGYYLKNTLSDHGGVNRGITTHAGGLLSNVEEIIEITRREDGSVFGTSVDGKERELDEDAIVSMNFWGFPPHFFTQLEDQFRAFLESREDLTTGECYIPTVVDNLIKANQASCQVLASRGSWFGITYPADLPIVVESVKQLVESAEYPSLLA
ncbi:MAG: NDP-sugar synthase [Roseibacillus sp.]